MEGILSMMGLLEEYTPATEGVKEFFSKAKQTIVNAATALINKLKQIGSFLANVAARATRGISGAMAKRNADIRPLIQQVDAMVGTYLKAAAESKRGNNPSETIGKTKKLIGDIKSWIGAHRGDMSASMAKTAAAAVNGWIPKINAVKNSLNSLDEKLENRVQSLSEKDTNDRNRARIENASMKATLDYNTKGGSARLVVNTTPGVISAIGMAANYFASLKSGKYQVGIDIPEKNEKTANSSDNGHNSQKGLPAGNQRAISSGKSRGLPPPSASNESFFASMAELDMVMESMGIHLDHAEDIDEVDELDLASEALIAQMNSHYGINDEDDEDFYC